jgi:hypothetical protein
MGKLQAHEERVNKIQEDMGKQPFFQSKMVLDIHKRVEDVDKTKKETNLEKEVMTASTSQSVDRIKQTS